MLRELDLWTVSTILGLCAAGCEVIRKQVWRSQQVFPKEAFSLCSPGTPSMGAQMSGKGTLGDGVKSTQMFSERKLLRLKNPPSCEWVTYFRKPM